MVSGSDESSYLGAGRVQRRSLARNLLGPDELQITCLVSSIGSEEMPEY